MAYPSIVDLLAAYWGWDEGSGATTKDISEMGRTLTVPTGGWDAGGLFGGGFAPAADTDYGEASGGGIQLITQDIKVSVSAWLYLGGAPSAMWGSAHLLVSKEDTVGGSGFVLGFLTGTNDVSFRIYNSAGTPYTATYTETSTSGWVHYVGVYSGASSVLLYRNGVQVGTAVADGTLKRDATIPIQVGKGIQGIIDEVAIWTRALSVGEVTTLYNSGSGYQMALAALPPQTLSDFAYLTIPAAYRLSAVELVPAMLDELRIAFSITNIIRQVLGAWQYLANALGVYAQPQPVLNPNPVMISVTAPTLGNVTVSANVGPGTPGWYSWWWEFETDTGLTVFDKHITVTLPSRATVTSSFLVPLNVGFNGRRIRLAVQAQDSPEISSKYDETPTMWYSDWLTASGTNFDNIAPPSPTSEPPYIVENISGGPLTVYVSTTTLLLKPRGQLWLSAVEYGGAQIQTLVNTGKLRAYRLSQNFVRWNPVNTPA